MSSLYAKAANGAGRVLRLSHSKLATLRSCQVKFEFRHIRGIRMARRSYIPVGKGVDQAVSADLENKKTNGVALPEEAVQEEARAGVEQSWREDGGVELSPDEPSDENRAKGAAIDKAVRLATIHHRRVTPKLEPAHVQRRFHVELPGYGVELSGYIDVDEAGNAGMWDTKTAGKLPGGLGRLDLLSPGVWRGGDADRSQQLTIYALAKRALDGAFPEKVGLNVLVDTSKPQVVTMESARSEDDLDPFLRLVARSVRTIESGNFMPADPSAPASPCGWCEYRSICPFVRRGATVAVPAMGGTA